MTSESQLNKVIKDSLDWGYKIPDPSSEYNTIKRCFDGFGTLNSLPIYWEAKLLLKPQSFNLQRIEPHQIQSLNYIKQTLPQALCWVIVGINYGRGDIRLFIFDDLELLAQRRVNRDNVLKKELDKMEYLTIKKNKVDFTQFLQTKN